MTRKPYQYAVLKYRPSYLLDERVNIGLLFFFPEDQQTTFLFPEHLDRLKSLFPHTDLALLRTYFRAFRERANLLRQRDLRTEVQRPDLLEAEFLVPDATALFFSEWKKGFYSNLDELLEQYRRDYFGVYDAAAVPA